MVPSLGDGVERLLTLHTQSHLLLSDGSRSSLSQLHTALRQRDEDEDEEELACSKRFPVYGLYNAGLQGACLEAGGFVLQYHS